MIRIKLKEVIADKEFSENRVITLAEIAKETGIHRTTLSKIANERGYNTGTENIDKLFRFFKCEISDILQYLPENE